MSSLSAFSILCFPSAKYFMNVDIHLCNLFPVANCKFCYSVASLLCRFLVGQYVTIHDDVISHVNISNLKEEDGGEYACAARNSVSQVSHSARINVYGKQLTFSRNSHCLKMFLHNSNAIICPYFKGIIFCSVVILYVFLCGTTGARIA
jgi:hypothetical protein